MTNFSENRHGASPLVILVLLIAGCWPDALTAGANKAALGTDLETVKGRMLDSFLRSASATRAQTLMQSLRPNGAWPDIDYKDRTPSGWRTCRHLSNVRVLASAYKSPRSKLHGDRRLRQAIDSSLSYWLDNDFQNPNWWWNQIGVPKSLQATLLCMEGELSSQQRSQALKILKRAKIGMTGQNLVWVTELTAVRGILEKNPELVSRAYRRIAEEIRITTSEGLQADFSFHQHGPCLYNHGYGASFAMDCSRIAEQVAGTAFAFPPEKITYLASYLLDGSQWMARGAAADFGAEGREIARPGQSARYLSPAAHNLLTVTKNRQPELEALAARAAGKEAPPLEGNRHFWHSDLMTHHRAGYYASARMFSRRITNTDHPCNREGLKSHHIADGCNIIMRTGHEYRDIYPVWDWQKIPGTTVEQRARLQGSPRRKGTRDFVGGVSDGRYGLAAFDFVRDDLSARKCWVFFDDEYVCLGAGISCSSDNPVATTLSQCHLSGKVTVCEGGKTRQLSGGSHLLNGLTWVWHDGVTYRFFQPLAAHVEGATKRGSWRDISARYSATPVACDVFTLWLDHGKHPRNASYAYCVLPTADSPPGAGQSLPPVRILANTPSLQAVWHEKLCIAAIAFYQSGTIEIVPGQTLSVDTPCLLLWREQPGKVTISVTNPKNKEATVNLRVGGTQLTGDDVRQLSSPPGSQLALDLPGDIYAGQSLTRTLSKLLAREKTP